MADRLPLLVTRAEAQLLADVLRALRKGGSGFTVVPDVGVVVKTAQRRGGRGGRSGPALFARLTAAGSGGDGTYDAVECDVDGATLDGGRTWDGETDNLAELIELNGTTDLAVGAAGTGAVVQVLQLGDNWVFVWGGAALPAGGTQYQVLQRDGSGNAVWDYVRAHE